MIRCNIGDEHTNTARCIADYIEKETQCNALMYGSTHSKANCSRKQFEMYKNLQKTFTTAYDSEIEQVSTLINT
jgi:hypothetical protein